MKIKRILSAALAFALSASIMTVLPAAALTAGNEGELTDGTFTYELNENNEYTIVDVDTQSVFTKVPGVVNGYSVVAIGDQAFADCTFLTELTLPGSIRSIGDYAFSCCSGLRKVKIGRAHV